MDNNKDAFDFWYAVNNTEVVLMPSQQLETFGATVLNYHLVSELMDSVEKTRVREGRMQSHQPKIITPEAYAETWLEGFGDEAQKYVDWIREHEDLQLLQYGYKLKQESFSEHIISEDVRAVTARVEKDVRAKGDPLSAIVVGVDKPWDVCLIRLFFEVVQGSVATNIQQLRRRNQLNSPGQARSALRQEIEHDFLAASKDPSGITALGQKLQKAGLFEQYEDRFFALLKAKDRRR